MDVSQIMNIAIQQVSSALNPQGSTSNSQVSNTAAQGIQTHHHHHHKSMADMISKMDSAIDDAIKAGKLTNDQASQMKKELDSITAKLNNSQTSGTHLTSDDLKQVKTEFQDVRKRLFDALNPQASTSASNGMSALFKQMDANGDGIIDKNELSTFISTLI